MNELFHAIRSLDAAICRFLWTYASDLFLDRLASHEEANNLLKGGIFFFIYWYLWFRATPDQNSRRRTIIAAITGALLSVIVARAAAIITPFRVRPIYDPTLTHPFYPIPLSGNLEHWSSFPSDTAAYFFALAFGIAYLRRRLALPVMLYTAVWICLPRMYLGLHYFTDIVAGGLIGISVAWFSVRSDLLQSVVVRRVLTATDKSPEWFYAVAFLVSFEMATIFQELRDTGRGVLHALFALHVPFRHANGNRPIDEWLEFLAVFGLAGAAYVAVTLYRKFQANRLVRFPERELETGRATDDNQ